MIDVTFVSPGRAKVDVTRSEFVDTKDTYKLSCQESPISGTPDSEGLSLTGTYLNNNDQGTVRVR